MKNLLYHLSFLTRCGICLMLFSMFLTSCDSDDAPSQESLLPPITMTGENTFGCLIDGKSFKPRDGGSTISTGNKGMSVLRTEEKNLEISVFDFKSDKRTSLFIHLENFYINGEESYPLMQATGLRGLDGPNHNYVYCILWRNNDYEVFYSFENSGEFLINKIDTTLTNKRIFAGEFDVILNNIDRTDSIQLSLGRFDIETQSLSSTTFD
jgi:hypothetical protein